jgi:hypothetical protein
LNWEQEHLKEGRYTLNMVQIDHKIRQVINTIKMAEAEEAHQLNKIEDCIPRSFCSYLNKSYIVEIRTFTKQSLALYIKIIYILALYINNK